MISRERWVRLKPLVEPALELTPEEIPAYLDQACRDDPELREEAEQLLLACAHGRRSLGFLDSPAAELAAPLLELDPLSLDSPEALEAGVTLGPYTIDRRLGAGGMGVVYLAHDPRLDRKVALKLLPPWLAADEVATRRFAQEAMAASRLDHPNIQTVYEIGEAPDGRLYIAMAYYDGETLRERIGRGPLEVGSAVELARQIAEGLAAAHARGIVHRDIKPSNLIVTPEGVAKILDFGAAKVVGHGLTVSGTTLGTVAYMSPEQTRRDDVDGRTDIWSLGVVLYEMLTGRHPFPAQVPDAVIYAIRNDEPEPMRQFRSDVPEPLARVVHRCLEKEPRARFRDAASLASALRRTRELASGSTGRLFTKGRLAFLGAAGLFAAVLVGSTLVWPRIRPGDASPEPVGEAALLAASRLAVLPLTESSLNEEDDYFADGLTEDLISHLSQLGTLRVIALASVLAYKGTDKGVSEIARELGVGTLLTGSAHKTGEQIQLSVRLVDAVSQAPLWTHDYAAAVVELPALQREIAEEVVATLHVQMPARERRLPARRGTESAAALQLYYQGRHFLAKLATPGATQQAREYFERALDLDPNFALAWAGLAGAYNQLAVQGSLPAADAEPRAKEAAELALELDPELAEGHTHLAAVLSGYYWNNEDAERHFRRALELEPSSARTHRHYAVHLRNLGRFEEALTMVRRAGELDPLSPGTYAQEGMILYMAHRYQEAIAKFQQLLRVDPQYTAAYFYLALAYVQLDRLEEALAALQATDPQVHQPGALAARLSILTRLGRHDEARRILAQLNELSGSRPFLWAWIYVALGDHERALDLLEQAVEEGTWPKLRMLKVEPSFDPLRSDPRFQVLLEKLNLAG